MPGTHEATLIYPTPDAEHLYDTGEWLEAFRALSSAAPTWSLEDTKGESERGVNRSRPGPDHVPGFRRNSPTFHVGHQIGVPWLLRTFASGPREARMGWSLRPDKYECPRHLVDLTSEVETEALAGPYEVPGGADGNVIADSPAEGYSPAGPFSVFVTCPGDPSKGDDAKPHEQLFQGHVQ